MRQAAVISELPTSSRQHSGPSATVTSGALYAELPDLRTTLRSNRSDFNIISPEDQPDNQRTVRMYEVRFTTRQEAEPPATNSLELVSNQVSQLSAVAGTSASQPQPDVITAEGISIIYLVGFSHTIQCHPGLKGSSIHLPAETILLEDWTEQAINSAASKLRQKDLRNALVLFWLYDELVLEQQETGELLTRSCYDNRLHCEGPLSVIQHTGMKKLWQQTNPLLGACKEAQAILIMTPLPRYITVPCCELSSHCTGFYLESSARALCRGMGELREALIRYVSRMDADNIFVAAPHLEIMEAAKLARDNPARHLADAFGFDGIHLTFDGYKELMDQIWHGLLYQPWRLRPPMANMASPHVGPPAVQPSRRRPGPRYDYAEFEDAPAQVHSRKHTSTYTEDNFRSWERGPWQNSEVQDQGPLVAAADWDRIRQSSRTAGYKPASNSRGLPPG